MQRRRIVEVFDDTGKANESEISEKISNLKWTKPWNRRLRDFFISIPMWFEDKNLIHFGYRMATNKSYGRIAWERHKNKIFVLIGLIFLFLIHQVYLIYETFATQEKIAEDLIQVEIQKKTLIDPLKEWNYLPIKEGTCQSNDGKPIKIQEQLIKYSHSDCYHISLRDEIEKEVTFYSSENEINRVNILQLYRFHEHIMKCEEDIAYVAPTMYMLDPTQFNILPCICSIQFNNTFIHMSNPMISHKSEQKIKVKERNLLNGKEEWQSYPSEVTVGYMKITESQTDFIKQNFTSVDSVHVLNCFQTMIGQ